MNPLHYRAKFAIKMATEGHAQLKSALDRLDPEYKTAHFWKELIEKTAIRPGKTNTKLEILRVIESDAAFEKLPHALFDDLINTLASRSKSTCFTKIMQMQESTHYQPSPRTQNTIKWCLRREQWPAIDVIWPEMGTDDYYRADLLNAVMEPWFLKNPARAAAFSNIPLNDIETAYLSKNFARNLTKILAKCSDTQKSMVARSFLLLIDKGHINSEILKEQAKKEFSITPNPVELFLIETDRNQLQMSTPIAHARPAARRM